MLNVCDLSTDGAFTTGAAVGAVVAISGHPYLAIFAAMFAGIISGFIVAVLQTKMGIDSLLAGIIVNTGAYSINIAIMGNSSLLNMNSTETIFTKMKSLTDGTPLASYSKLIVAVIVVLLICTLLAIFLKTRLGLAVRATGDNPDMVKSSSINTAVITIIGLCISNSFTALSGCLLAEYNKSCNIDIGTGMLTVALASLLIGRMFFKKGGAVLKISGAVLGAVLFRIVYTLALRLHMPASMLKLVSSIIVIIAISGPYFAKKAQEKALHAKLYGNSGEVQ
ncbi:MAG: ABC transporter permease [Lachnospiraceae bacterium]|nr:ABC transporter permease [Lachnospiraceae bacterium]